MYIFHLAIPSRDLAESKEFYEKLGAEVGREYKTHIVLKFYGCQLVIHKADEWERMPKMYPRHFGIIIEPDHDEVFAKFLHWQKEYPERIFEDLFTRHEGSHEEHTTFFLIDPSNNVIEFKSYKNHLAIFS